MLQRVQAAVDKAARTGGDAAVSLGLPAGWAVTPKPTSRQVIFTAPDGKRLRSVKELAQVLGEVPESLSGGSAQGTKLDAKQGIDAKTIEAEHLAEKSAAKLADEEQHIGAERADAAHKAELEVPKPAFNSGGGLLKMVLDAIKSGKTEQEAAAALGLSTGWLASPKEASRQVHFISPGGKRYRSIRELGQALGKLPEAFSVFSRDLILPAPRKKRAETPKGSIASSSSKRNRLSQLETVGKDSESRQKLHGTTNTEKVSMFGAAQAAIGKYKTDAEIAEALGLPEGWKVTVDCSMKVVFFYPPGRPRIRGPKELTALLGGVPEALGGGLRHCRSDFDEDVYKAVRDYIKQHPTTWSLSLMILELSERHGWSRDDPKDEDALKVSVKAAISRCGYKGLSAMSSAYTGSLYKGS